MHGKGIDIPIIILENVAKAATFSTDISTISVEAYAAKPLDSGKIIDKIKVIINR
jgi:AmiR/NasT family two-component response regulator